MLLIPMLNTIVTDIKYSQYRFVFYYYYATFLRLRRECHIRNLFEICRNLDQFLSTSDAIWPVSTVQPKLHQPCNPNCTSWQIQPWCTQRAQHDFHAWCNKHAIPDELDTWSVRSAHNVEFNAWRINGASVL